MTIEEEARNCLLVYSEIEHERIIKSLKKRQERIDELESALKPFIENYDKYGNHGPFAHGLFQRAKKAIGGGND